MKKINNFLKINFIIVLILIFFANNVFAIDTELNENHFFFCNEQELCDNLFEPNEIIYLETTYPEFRYDIEIYKNDVIYETYNNIQLPMTIDLSSGLYVFNINYEDNTFIKNLVIGTSIEDNDIYDEDRTTVDPLKEEKRNNLFYIVLFVIVILLIVILLKTKKKSKPKPVKKTKNRRKNRRYMKCLFVFIFLFMLSCSVFAFDLLEDLEINRSDLEELYPYPEEVSLTIIPNNKHYEIYVPIVSYDNLLGDILNDRIKILNENKEEITSEKIKIDASHVLLADKDELKIWSARHPLRSEPMMRNFPSTTPFIVGSYVRLNNYYDQYPINENKNSLIRRTRKNLELFFGRDLITSLIREDLLVPMPYLLTIIVENQQYNTQNFEEKEEVYYLDFSNATVFPAGTLEDIKINLKYEDKTIDYIKTDDEYNVVQSMIKEYGWKNQKTTIADLSSFNYRDLFKYKNHFNNNQIIFTKFDLVNDKTFDLFFKDIEIKDILVAPDFLKGPKYHKEQGLQEIFVLTKPITEDETQERYLLVDVFHNYEEKVTISESLTNKNNTDSGRWYNLIDNHINLNDLDEFRDYSFPNLSVAFNLEENRISVYFEPFKGQNQITPTFISLPLKVENKDGRKVNGRFLFRINDQEELDVYFYIERLEVVKRISQNEFHLLNMNLDLENSNYYLSILNNTEERIIENNLTLPTNESYLETINNFNFVYSNYEDEKDKKLIDFTVAKLLTEEENTETINLSLFKPYMVIGEDNYTERLEQLIEEKYNLLKEIEYIKKLGLTDVDFITEDFDIDKKRLELIRKGRLGQICDPSEKISGTNEYLFNIRPENEIETSVYACAGNANFNNTWIDSYKYCYKEGNLWKWSSFVKWNDASLTHPVRKECAPIDKRRAEIAKTATTDDPCNPEKMMFDYATRQELSLFNIKHTDKDSYVYVCTGDGRARVCDVKEQKWLPIFDPKNTRDPEHPVRGCIIEPVEEPEEPVKEIECVSGGEGTLPDPIIVCTPEDLDNVRNDLKKFYRQGQDIDLRDYDFKPIGESKMISDSERDVDVPVVNSFEGLYDGGNYTISNLVIEVEDQSNVGLFGLSKGIIRNVNIDNFRIESKKTGDAHVSSTGILLGENLERGNIYNTTIKNSTVRGYSSVGAIGRNKGTILNSKIITEDGTNTVVFGNQNVGGLVGYNEKTGNIKDCSSENIWVRINTNNPVNSFYFGGLVGTNEYGKITSSKVENLRIRSEEANIVGGFVGRNYGEYNDHISESNVKNTFVVGEKHVGGFVGVSSGEAKEYVIGQTADISQSFVENVEVKGEENVGGFVGLNRDSFIHSSYGINIDVNGHQNIGGFVGSNSGTQSEDPSVIVDSFVKEVNVVGEGNNVGGFAGLNLYIIYNSYVTGDVKGNDYVGCFIGNNFYEGEFKYYDENLISKINVTYFSNGNNRGFMGSTWPSNFATYHQENLFNTVIENNGCRLKLNK